MYYFFIEREGGVEKSTERLVAVKPEEKPESVQLTKSGLSKNNLYTKIHDRALHIAEHL